MAPRKTRTARRATPRRRASQRKVARPWTREEIAFLRKYYRKFETSWIARQLGRTVYSVRYKASDLNVKKANPSVWKGNRGSKNAFSPKNTTRRRPTRTTKSRGTNRKRTYKATTSRRRTSRTAKPRRRSRR